MIDFAFEQTKDGVWVVATSWQGYSETVHAILPGDQELEARRLSDRLGYGEVVFVQFGVEL